MDLKTARELVRDERIWPLALEFALKQEKPFFHSFPKEDGSRLALIDESTRKEIAAWLEVVANWKALKDIVDGAKVRELKARLGNAFPAAIKYAPYFAKWKLPEGEGAALLATAMKKAPKEVLFAQPLKKGEVPLAAVMKLLEMKFPEAYKLCLS